MNKKLLMFGIVGIFAAMLVTAGLVSYLSNTTTGTINVDSPITITSLEGNPFSLSMYAGESKSIDFSTEIHVDGVTGHIGETKISDFDGEGLTIEYRVGDYPGVFQIPVCISGDDAYFYIGDPEETLDKSEFTSKTTFIAALNLDPDRTYNVESKVIMADSAACDYDQPTFIPDTA